MNALRVIVQVAPLAGAWIETGSGQYLRNDYTVAPLAGAWIETREMIVKVEGHPQVAPLAGAWIET